MTSDVSESFTAWLDRHLRQRGWSQRDLAAKLGFSEAHMSRVRTGGRPATQDTCRHLAQLFGVSVEEAWRVAGHPLPSSEPPPLTFADAVEADPVLTRQQKRILLDLYDSWLRGPSSP